MQSVWEKKYAYFSRWCGIAMEFLGAAIVFFASLFASLQRDTLSAGLAGLSVSYSQQVYLFELTSLSNVFVLERAEFL